MLGRSEGLTGADFEVESIWCVVQTGGDVFRILLLGLLSSSVVLDAAGGRILGQGWGQIAALSRQETSFWNTLQVRRTSLHNSIVLRNGQVQHVDRDNDGIVLCY